ncbi:MULTISPECIES: WecB/TagA/CpsF family glycosyltransferase [unclassified Leptolyngbya]|uniref:WecB/TagA/CpsF family glycosyltransferase n=1 Tax=unclassified Leptolyngbya TaxID=2650499 RepID=UPI0016878634|nr:MULTISPECIES: WecB/TagA/CpsF family glycosyltransferase [unclassified Leptolyngbya]MBD1909285.1 WecB/TagA/CpsF family glycosyltransferase [Leptolyngbya sp. FACHB-8]MBD2153515.1 WecB/TagA/CpsF family glycosyltransferase [Leptolyngbya sp. FACHB-16]
MCAIATNEPQRVSICNVDIDRYSFQETVDQVIEAAIAGGPPRYVVTPNAHHTVMLQEDAYFREVYKHAYLSVPDGVPLLWAGKLLGRPLKGRVNGTDLFEAVCAAAALRGLRVFLLGGRPGAADAAADLLKTRNPGLTIAGTYCPPYGFERDRQELEHINTLIREAQPHILFVGLGAPKQENWMYEQYQAIGVPISLGIGVSFELVSGMVQRAPRWMQVTGMEWLFRLFMEPQRLWKRYIVGNTVFCWLVLKQYLGLLKPPTTQSSARAS